MSVFAISIPNAYLGAVFSTISEDDDTIEENESRTELDLHANMPVVGSDNVVLVETGKFVDVSAYSPEYPVKQVLVIDAAIQYDDPYDGSSRFLLIKNSLQVPSMKNNLLPQFLMQEAGLVVNDTPKIHVVDPGVDDHSIYFPELKYRIPLSLSGIFSYFLSSKPTLSDLNNAEEEFLLVLTPDQWNPHDSTFSFNEASMLDWKTS